MRRLFAVCVVLAACATPPVNNDNDAGDAAPAMDTSTVVDATVVDATGDATVATDALTPLDATADGSVDVASDTASDVPIATDVAVGPPRCSAMETPCSDQAAERLQYFDRPSPDMITQTSATGGVFVEEVDATNGGFTITQSYVYARFGVAGLERVAVSDIASLTSLDWDIAFRKSTIRVNSGPSGPSCVDVATTAAGTRFESLTRTPAGLTYAMEQYFTDRCALIEDDSGIASLPNTQLASYFAFEGCVRMTGNVFVIRLRDGRTVRFQVLSYYPPEVQSMCDATNTVPMISGAGRVRVRWSFLPP